MSFEEWWRYDRKLGSDKEAAEKAWNAAIDEAVKAVTQRNVIANTGIPTEKDTVIINSINAIKELKK